MTSSGTTRTWCWPPSTPPVPVASPLNCAARPRSQPGSTQGRPQKRLRQARRARSRRHRAGLGPLTGKYHAGNKPGGIRRVLPSFRGSNFDALPPVIELLTEIGKKHDATPFQVALRWVIQKGAVPIPGARNAAQARSNAGALNIVLDQSEMDALDEATTTWRK